MVSGRFSLPKTNPLIVNKRVSLIFHWKTHGNHGFVVDRFSHLDQSIDCSFNPPLLLRITFGISRPSRPWKPCPPRCVWKTWGFAGFDLTTKNGDWIGFNQGKLVIYWDLSIMTDIYRHVNQQKSVNLIDKNWLIFFWRYYKVGPQKAKILPNHGVRFFSNPNFRFVPKPCSGVLYLWRI